ncbi:hypothetical protein [uncultured Cohaesibacter sp.]|uniref:hypothetical protein n=1 Tax=uncultured Cohaesibacter sp. TaxID=1002546 RepID=UPI0037490A52
MIVRGVDVELAVEEAIRGGRDSDDIGLKLVRWALALVGLFHHQNGRIVIPSE